ncbi:hypothetical protein Cadr_000026347 [Camelus dromedarius]|uniref:Uncharacterized protein n=1 Tax=Camelus dromedarius TaxID=9838 RepID=A0A5N4CEF7_CAMDR|nr:hypothetical protein Cadr_000026347 [Camelus dromedarius]
MRFVRCQALGLTQNPHPRSPHPFFPFLSSAAAEYPSPFPQAPCARSRGARPTGSCRACSPSATGPRCLRFCLPSLPPTRDPVSRHPSGCSGHPRPRHARGAAGNLGLPQTTPCRPGFSEFPLSGLTGSSVGNPGRALGACLDGWVCAERSWSGSGRCWADENEKTGEPGLSGIYLLSVVRRSVSSFPRSWTRALSHIYLPTYSWTQPATPPPSLPPPQPESRTLGLTIQEHFSPPDPSSSESSLTLPSSPLLPGLVDSHSDFSSPPPSGVFAWLSAGPCRPCRRIFLKNARGTGRTTQTPALGLAGVAVGLRRCQKENSPPASWGHARAGLLSRPPEDSPPRHGLQREALGAGALLWAFPPDGNETASPPSHCSQVSAAEDGRTADLSGTDCEPGWGLAVTEDKGRVLGGHLGAQQEWSRRGPGDPPGFARGPLGNSRPRRPPGRQGSEPATPVSTGVQAHCNSDKRPQAFGLLHSGCWHTCLLPGAPLGVGTAAGPVLFPRRLPSLLALAVFIPSVEPGRACVTGGTGTRSPRAFEPFMKEGGVQDGGWRRREQSLGGHDFKGSPLLGAGLLRQPLGRAFPRSDFRSRSILSVPPPAPAHRRAPLPHALGLSFADFATDHGTVMSLHLLCLCRPFLCPTHASTFDSSSNCPLSDLDGDTSEPGAESPAGKTQPCLGGRMLWASAACSSDKYPQDSSGQASVHTVQHVSVQTAGRCGSGGHREGQWKDGGSAPLCSPTASPSPLLDRVRGMIAGVGPEDWPLQERSGRKCHLSLGGWHLPLAVQWLRNQLFGGAVEAGVCVLGSSRSTACFWGSRGPAHRHCPLVSQVSMREAAKGRKELWSLSGTKATDPEEGLRGMAGREGESYLTPLQTETLLGRGVWGMLTYSNVDFLRSGASRSLRCANDSRWDRCPHPTGQERASPKLCGRTPGGMLDWGGDEFRKACFLGEEEGITPMLVRPSQVQSGFRNQALHRLEAQMKRDPEEAGRPRALARCSRSPCGSSNTWPEGHGKHLLLPKAGAGLGYPLPASWFRAEGLREIVLPDWTFDSGPCLPLLLCSWVATGESLNFSELRSPQRKTAVLQAALLLSQATEADGLLQAASKPAEEAGVPGRGPQQCGRPVLLTLECAHERPRDGESAFLMSFWGMLAWGPPSGYRCGNTEITDSKPRSPRNPAPVEGPLTTALDGLGGVLAESSAPATLAAHLGLWFRVDLVSELCSSELPGWAPVSHPDKAGGTLASLPTPPRPHLPPLPQLGFPRVSGSWCVCVCIAVRLSTPSPSSSLPTPPSFPLPPSVIIKSSQCFLSRSWFPEEGDAPSHQAFTLPQRRCSPVWSSMTPGGFPGAGAAVSGDGLAGLRAGASEPWVKGPVLLSACLLVFLGPLPPGWPEHPSGRVAVEAVVPGGSLGHQKGVGAWGTQWPSRILGTWHLMRGHLSLLGRRTPVQGPCPGWWASLWGWGPARATCHPSRLTLPASSPGAGKGRASSPAEPDPLSFFGLERRYPLPGGPGRDGVGALRSPTQAVEAVLQAGNLRKDDLGARREGWRRRGGRSPRRSLIRGGAVSVVGAAQRRVLSWFFGLCPCGCRSGRSPCRPSAGVARGSAGGAAGHGSTGRESPGPQWELLRRFVCMWVGAIFQCCLLTANDLMLAMQREPQFWNGLPGGASHKTGVFPAQLLPDSSGGLWCTHHCLKGPQCLPWLPRAQGLGYEACVEAGRGRTPVTVGSGEPGNHLNLRASLTCTESQSRDRILDTLASLPAHTWGTKKEEQGQSSGLRRPPCQLPGAGSEGSEAREEMVPQNAWGLAPAPQIHFWRTLIKSPALSLRFLMCEGVFSTRNRKRRGLSEARGASHNIPIHRSEERGHKRTQEESCPLPQSALRNFILLLVLILEAQSSISVLHQSRQHRTHLAEDLGRQWLIALVSWKGKSDMNGAAAGMEGGGQKPGPNPPWRNLTEITKQLVVILGGLDAQQHLPDGVSTWQQLWLGGGGHQGRLLCKENTLERQACCWLGDVECPSQPSALCTLAPPLVRGADLGRVPPCSASTLWNLAPPLAGGLFKNRRSGLTPSNNESGSTATPVQQQRQKLELGWRPKHQALRLSLFMLATHLSSWYVVPIKGQGHRGLGRWGPVQGHVARRWQSHGVDHSLCNTLWGLREERWFGTTGRPGRRGEEQPEYDVELRKSGTWEAAGFSLTQGSGPMGGMQAGEVAVVSVSSVTAYQSTFLDPLLCTKRCARHQRSQERGDDVSLPQEALCRANSESENHQQCEPATRDALRLKSQGGRDAAEPAGSQLQGGADLERRRENKVNKAHSSGRSAEVSARQMALGPGRDAQTRSRGVLRWNSRRVRGPYSHPGPWHQSACGPRPGSLRAPASKERNDATCLTGGGRRGRPSAQEGDTLGSWLAFKEDTLTVPREPRHVSLQRWLCRGCPAEQGRAPLHDLAGSVRCYVNVCGGGAVPSAASPPSAPLSSSWFPPAPAVGLWPSVRCHAFSHWPSLEASAFWLWCRHTLHFPLLLSLSSQAPGGCRGDSSPFPERLAEAPARPRLMALGGARVGPSVLLPKVGPPGAEDSAARL